MPCPHGCRDCTEAYFHCDQVARGNMSSVAHVIVLSGGRGRGSGLNLEVSTALGITKTRSGGRQARRTVFSLLMCDTQMTACTSQSVHLRSLLVQMLAASAKPKREWSVNATGYPMVRACSMHSFASTENAWCPCTCMQPSCACAPPPRPPANATARW